MIQAEWSMIFMLSEQQRRTALKKNIEYARAMARCLRAEGVDGVTLTHFADEASFHAMRLPEEGDDFEYRQLVNAETAKIMIAHGLALGYYPPPRRHVFLTRNQQVTPISNRYRVESNDRRDVSSTASCQAVWVISSGKLLA